MVRAYRWASRKQAASPRSRAMIRVYVSVACTCCDLLRTLYPARPRVPRDAPGRPPALRRAAAFYEISRARGSSRARVRVDRERCVLRGCKEREAPRGGALCERLLMHRLVCLSDHLTAPTASKAAALSSPSVHISAAFE